MTEVRQRGEGADDAVRRQSVVHNDDPSTDVHQALLTEHFGFHPRVFVDALVYAANEHLYSIGGQFEEFAKKQLKAACKKAAKREREQGKTNEKSKSSASSSSSSSKLAKMTSTQVDAEAERGVHAVLTLMENALDHIFDLLELYCLKIVFGVRPSHACAMTLKHHRGLDLRTSAERAAQGEALTSAEEYEGLSRREGALRQRVEHAKRVRHALRIANVAVEESVARARRVTDAFAVVTGSDTITSPLDDTTPQSARKLRADAHALVDALEKLAQTDPLGASLTSSATTSSVKDKRDVLEASGVTETDTRLWERGREAYINWEIDRIVRNVRSRANVGANDSFVTTTGDVTGFGGETLMFDTTAIRGLTSSSSSSYAPSGSKRRRTTTGRVSATDARTDSDHQAAQIGHVGDVEALANILGEDRG